MKPYSTIKPRSGIVFPLLGLILIQICFLIWLGRQGAISALRNEFTKPAPQVTSLAEWKKMVALDPKPGAILPAVTVTTLNGERLTVGHVGKPVAMLFIKGCAPCMASYLKRWALLEKNMPNIQFLVVPETVDTETINQFENENHYDLAWVSVGNDQLVQACNIYFVPRICVCDKTGKETLLQAPASSMDTTFADVQHRLNR